MNSISYDATSELGNNGTDPAPWIPSSVWGPLRVVTAVKNVVAMSDHLDSFDIIWEDFNPPHSYVGTGGIDYRSVLGGGFNRFALKGNEEVWAANPQTIAYLAGRKYTVWSIHTYYHEFDNPTVQEFHGEIISQDKATVLGYVYFKPNQWVCSYGMKWVEDDVAIRLAFKNGRSTPTEEFYITDYQIVQFTDLASANSWLNSRVFACHYNHK